MLPLVVKPGDIFLTANTTPWWKPSGFVSAGIRFFTRDRGESRTKVNHVGIVVGSGSPQYAEIVEALTTVKRRRMGAYRRNVNTDVAIFRPLNLTDDELAVIVARAEGYVGAKYGYVKIVAHLADWCLGGVYVFRRVAAMDRYPICSWVVAQAYADAGKDFGVPAGSASPDDIWDFAVANPDKYAVVHPLEMLP